MAYMTRDWRVLLQVFSGIHILTPLILNFICESPKWLISTGMESKIGEAKTILQEINMMNEKKDLNMDLKEITTDNTQHRESFLIIFKTLVILKRTLILWIN